ncbi:MAG: HlyD family type I secretion periplasmic adaptor subunit [Rhodobiaceae bacterium]|nr:HlyD family type I secretion periplasmic adaptor subunit [Rhodobiaceae bacterium]
MDKADLSDSHSRSLIRLGVTSVVVVGTLLVGSFVWAQKAYINGAVIAPGRFVVETQTKKIQHSEGGYVKEILVKDGDVVSAGDELVRLDDTQIMANLEIVTAQLNEAVVTEARLLAEQAGETSFEIPDEELSLAVLGDRLDRVIEGQRELLKARHESIQGQIRQLQEQIGQFDELITGLQVQRDAKQTEIKLIADELEDVVGLFKKGLTTQSRVTALQRDKARLEGELGGLIAEIARASQNISERRVQMIRVKDDARSDTLAQLQDLRLKKSGFIQQKLALEDKLRRLDIRAPQDGVVHELAIHTIGGVVGAGEVLMLLVPDHDHLIIETQINPRDVDQVHVGQEAMLHLTSFNQRYTPAIAGSVITVSPDVGVNPVDHKPFYFVRIAIKPGELEKLGPGKEIVPGMPVEAFIRTSERTVMAYLLQPLTDQLTKAFREE